MNYSTHLYLLLTSLLTAQIPQDDPTPHRPAPAELPEVLQPALQELLRLVEDFRSQPVSPANTHAFEHQLQEQLRQLGRHLCQWTYNHLEPQDVHDLPRHVHFEASLYRRLGQKTPQNVWTLFGQVRLWRLGYRPSDHGGDPTIFPLALSLGLVGGATPALAGRAARLLAESGSTQQQTLLVLRREHDVGWGVKKLRQVTQALSEGMAGQRHDAQVGQLLEWLGQATASRGRHKPVVSVGRDGITLGMRGRGGSHYEVASTATVTVRNRRGRRLGTVYLAWGPQPGQVTLGEALTRLLQEVLRRWAGPLPRLCYVSDAGDKETTYYEKVLHGLKHPCTGKELAWLRVLDYYHASERIWKMAELLFGKGRRASSWARKMQKWLLKPGGVNRVLHSAAAYRQLYGLRGEKRRTFATAYAYLRKRMAYMRYADYRAMGVPLGSGVTEAACKTIYTQRLKLSGMRWKQAGAQVVLNLRVLLLSGVWEEAYHGVLNDFTEAKVRGGQRVLQQTSPEKAA